MNMSIELSDIRKVLMLGIVTENKLLGLRTHGA